MSISTKSIWIEKPAGKWKRKNVKPFNKCSPEDLAFYYACPTCPGLLTPTDIKFRLICNSCGLMAGTGFGSLYAPAKLPCKE